MNNLWNLWHEASLASSGCYQRLEVPQAAVPSTRPERMERAGGQPFHVSHTARTSKQPTRAHHTCGLNWCMHRLARTHTGSSQLCMGRAPSAASAHSELVMS